MEECLYSYHARQVTRNGTKVSYVLFPILSSVYVRDWHTVLATVKRPKFARLMIGSEPITNARRRATFENKQPKDGPINLLPLFSIKD